MLTLQPIDWNADLYEITDGVTMELSPYTALSHGDLVKEVVSVFEDSTPFEYYVYCFQFDGDKWYVGETKNLAQRISTHSTDKSIENLEVVEGVESREEAREREREMSYEIAIKKGTTEIYGGR